MDQTQLFFLLKNIFFNRNEHCRTGMRDYTCEVLMSSLIVKPVDLVSSSTPHSVLNLVK